MPYSWEISWNASRPTAVSRLTPIDFENQLLPWRRAAEITRCFLYWTPVSCFPIPTEQRQWLMIFLDRLTEFLTGNLGLRPETFLQFKLLEPTLMKPFLNHARESNPILGLSRRPRAKLQEYPDAGEIKTTFRKMVEGSDPPDPRGYMPDYCYWFLNKDERKQRQLFFGYGGMTTILLAQDPNCVPPKLPFSPTLLKNLEGFGMVGIEKRLAAAYALKDGFLAKSKTLFGTGLEDEPQFGGLPFILPLLRTQDFFNEPDEEARKWFQLFDVYINESPDDRGIVMASSIDFKEALIRLLELMRQEGLHYPER